MSADRINTVPVRTSIPNGAHGGCEQRPTSFGLLFANGSALNLECPECVLLRWTGALQCPVVSLRKPRGIASSGSVPFCPICQLRIVDRLFSHFFAVYQSATGIPHLIEVSVSRPSQTEVKPSAGIVNYSLPKERACSKDSHNPCGQSLITVA